MESKCNHRKIALEMKSAQDKDSQIEPFTSRLKGFSSTDAYIIAHMIHEMRIEEGAVPIGRKIGFTNPEMWSIYGVREPIWGYIYDTTVKQLTEPHAHCRVGSFVEPKLEPEIIVHFQTPPPLTDNPQQVLASIDWIAHGIEIVQSHFPKWKFRAADTIADAGLHASLLIGPKMNVKQLGPELVSDLEQFSITLSCGGKVCERGRGSNALGSALLAVSHLTAVLSTQSKALPLQAGEIVTTGTLTAALPICEGQNWSTNLEGISLPGISLSIES